MNFGILLIYLLCLFHSGYGFRNVAAQNKKYSFRNSRKYSPISHSIEIGDVHDGIACHMIYYVDNVQKLNLTNLMLILKEQRTFPLPVHNYIHTNVNKKRFEEILKSYGNNAVQMDAVTILFHPLEWNSFKKMKGVNMEMSKLDLFPMVPSIRQAILKIGRNAKYSMYIARDLLVHKAVIDLYLNRSQSVLKHGYSLSFNRVECIALSCNWIDINAPFKNISKDLVLIDNHYYVVNRRVEYNNHMWIYDQLEFIRLTSEDASFLKVENDSVSPWDRIGLGGLKMGNHDNRNNMYNSAPYGRGVLIPMLNKRLFDPAAVTLQLGAKHYARGLSWCSLIYSGIHYLCEPIPSRLVEHGTDNLLPPGTKVATLPRNILGVSIYDTLKPHSLKTCDATKLVFNHSKMLVIASPLMYMPTIPGHSIQVAYGPWLTKCGSSTAVHMIRMFTGDDYQTTTVPLTAAHINDYVFISFVRHPLNRILSGFHQLEIFVRLNWYARTIREFGLQWWNHYCLDSPYGVKPRKHICSGSIPNNDLSTVLSRLIGFLEEVEEIGFYDQHITPISYLIATNPIQGDARVKTGVRNDIDMNTDTVPATKKALIFDLYSMNSVGTLLGDVTGMTWPNISAKERMVGNTNNEYPWTINWKDLVAIDATNPLRNRVIALLCRLYRVDVECLPYSIPECNSIYGIEE